MDKQNRLYTVISIILLSLSLGTFACYANEADLDTTDTLTTLSAEQAFALTAQSTNDHKVELQFTIAPGYVLYQKHFKFRTLQGQVIDAQSVLPAPVIKHDNVLGDYPVYTGQIKLIMPLEASTTKTEPGFRIEYQGCSENGFCYAPIAKKIIYSNNGTMRITDLTPEAFTATSAAVATANTSLATTLSTEQTNVTEPVTSESDFLTHQLKNGAFPMTFLLFLGIGILLSFTPCVLPMVPILANILVGEKTPLSSRRAILLASLYVLSVAACYAIAGVAAGLMGSYLQVTLQKPIFLISLSFLLLLFALSQFNLVHVQLPQVFTQTLHDIQRNQKQGSIFGAIAMGFVSALVVSPCVTPALVGALSYIGQTGNALLGGMALFALALGMGLPLLAVACVGSRYLPKAGPWMGHIKTITGIFLLILAGIFLTRALPTASSTVPNPEIATRFVTIQNKADLETALATAHKTGKPVILDVYADWCVSCKQIDKDLFENNKVLTTLKDATLLRLDMTNQTQDIAQLQKDFGIVGPPTLLFFGTDGQENRNFRLVGKIESLDFVKHFDHFLNTQNK